MASVNDVKAADMKATDVFSIAGKTVRVRAFKNRHLDNYPLNMVNVRLAGQSWCTFSGVARATSNDNGTHQVEVVEEIDALNNIFPCAALVTIEFDGKLVAFTNLSYESVKVDAPGATMGQMVEIGINSSMTNEQIKANLGKIPKGVTRELKLPKKNLAVTLHLGFGGPDDETFHALVQKDDVTGDAYPYRLLRITLKNIK